MSKNFHVDSELRKVLDEIFDEKSTVVADAVSNFAQSNGVEVFVTTFCRSEFGNQNLSVLSPVQLDRVCRFLIVLMSAGEINSDESIHENRLASTG
jgi:hypothetical protein